MRDETKLVKMAPALRVLLVSIFLTSFAESLTGQFGPNIEIDCNNDTELISVPLDLSSGDPFEPDVIGCARADSKLQSLITYTVTNRNVVGAIDAKLWSSKGFVYVMEWKIEGGKILVGNGESVSSVCIGEGNQAIGPSLSICPDGLSGKGEFGPSGSFLRSSVKVQWDNKASSVKPKISVALKIQTASKFKIKVKTALGSFKEILTSGKLSTKYELCKKEMYLGYDLFDVEFISSNTSCKNGGSKTISITPRTAKYDGCLYPGITYQYEYAYRKNGGVLSTPRRVVGNTFTIANVGVADVIDLEVTPILGYGYRASTYRKSFVDVNKTTVSNIPEVFYIDEEPESQDFIVNGLNNLQVKFGLDILNYSPYTYRVVGNNSIRITWLQFPPIGVYALEITGNDKVCGQFVRLLIQFRIAKFSNSMSKPSKDDRTSYQPAEKLLRYRDGVAARDLRIGNRPYNIFPSPIVLGQNIVLEKSYEDVTEDCLIYLNIYDVSGRLVLRQLNRASSSKINIPTDALVKGVYILSIHADNEAYLQNHRFVVH